MMKPLQQNIQKQHCDIGLGQDLFLYKTSKSTGKKKYRQMGFPKLKFSAQQNKQQNTEIIGRMGGFLN